jgi:hypothetical protein
MRQIITREDINKISGKWIVELSFEDEHRDFTRAGNPDFWLEKRISFISTVNRNWFVPKEIRRRDDSEQLVLENGLYYNTAPFTIDEYLHHFNGTKSPTSEREPTRFSRLLTTKELKWLFKHLKQNIY